MQLLRSKLIELEERKRAEELARVRGEVKEVAWGSQIRSYFLHPDQRVKDHRTGHEVRRHPGRPRRRHRRLHPGLPEQDRRLLGELGAMPHDRARLTYLRATGRRTEAEGLLVLHHGRGTDERDLLGLADVLDPGRRLHVVTPRAPLRLPGSPGYHWYLVPRVGYPDHDTFHAAREALAELHDGLWEETGIEPRAHRPRRLLDGGGDELRDGAQRRSAAGRRDPRLQRLRAERRGLAARSRIASGPGPSSPTAARPGDRDRLRAARPRSARSGGLEVEYHESELGHQIDPAHLPRRGVARGELAPSR